MIYRVSPDGSDRANGTTAPLQTIARAQALAGPGDTILCHPGTYPPIENRGDNAKSGREGAHLKYLGEQGAILAGSSRYGGSARFENCDWWWLEGFELKAARGSQDRGRGVRATDVRNFVIRNNNVSRCEFDAINVGFAHDGLIEENEADGTAMVVVRGLGGHIVYISSSSSGIIARNNIGRKSNASAYQGNGNLDNRDTVRPSPVTGWIENSQFVGNVAIDCGSIGGAAFNLDRCRNDDGPDGQPVPFLDNNIAIWTPAADFDCGGVTVFHSTGREGSNVLIRRLTIVTQGRRDRHGIEVQAGCRARVERSIIIADPSRKQGGGQMAWDEATVWGDNANRQQALALFVNPDLAGWEQGDWRLKDPSLGIGWSPERQPEPEPPPPPVPDDRAALLDLLAQVETAHGRTGDALTQALALHREEGDRLARVRELVTR